MSIGERGKWVNEKKSHLFVDLKIYPTERGGRVSSIVPGWGCPCTVQSEQGTGWVAYDGWPQLGDNPMNPGETRRVGYVFLMGEEAVDYLRTARKFYLLEGKIIGEAVILNEKISD